VVAAENAYFAEHGVYFQGACNELPGYTPTDPGVEGAVITCGLYGTDTFFTVAMTHTLWPGVCEYYSGGNPPLDCH
jgi:hypothetical protein